MRVRHYKLLMFMFWMSSIAFAQQKTISGVVTDDKGLPLPGVNVLVKNTDNGTQTDFDGNYSINAARGAVLSFSYVSFTTKSIVVGDSDTINVQLVVSAAELEEVVVVAYGSQVKKKLVTSISTVSGDDLENIIADSPQNILQGQASGVQVFSSSGGLGAAPTINIRGSASITSNTRPLFVIDGVTLGDSFTTFNQGTGAGINPLASINPNDIESISVLKSAAASALYGSRGANGVVLITTKRGNKNGKVTVDIDINTSFSTITDTPDLLNAQEYIDFTTIVRNGSAVSANPLTSAGGEFDALDAILRTAVSQSYNFSIRGGTEKSNYFIGATREDVEGIRIGDNLERTSFRSNIQVKATDWLTATLNANVSHNRFDRVPNENSFASPYTIALLQRPDVEPFDDEGNFTTAGNVGGGNVIAQEALNLNLATTTRIIANGSLDFNLSSLIDGLSFKQDIGIDRTFTENQTRNVELLTPGGSAANSVFQQNRYILNSLLSYNKTFGDAHNLNLLAGYSFEDNQLRNVQTQGTGFLSDAQLNIESASTFPLTSSSGDATRLVSALGRAIYDYADGRYIVEGSIRRDGSSRFGANNRFGIFWSAAVGWNISDEAFMQNVDWIQGLKLNASYGTTGNDRIGTTNVFPALGLFAGNNYNGNPGLTPSTLSNPDLQWESTTTRDIGLTAAFFNRRLTFNVEYYNNVTDDLILNVPRDPTFNNGLNSVSENIGELENRGVDFTLDAVIFDGANDGFKWTSSLNLGFNENEVTNLPEGTSVDENGNKFVDRTGGSLAFSGQRAVEGFSVNTWYLIPYLGVNPQTGDAEWLDADGNATTTPVAADRRIVGQANPDLVGGFTNVFTFKNWSLNTLFNFSFGNDILLTSRAFSENPISGFNKTTRVLNVWQQPGDQAFIPSPDSATINTFSQNSTAQLEDGSFVRLKNVTLAYTLSNEHLEKTFINKIRLYATATNLLTFKSDGLDGYDPEVSNGSDGFDAAGQDFFTLPQASTYTFGINVSF
ncbi:TonB-dependent receptor [uncultured Aquimarina sp.]|uniref:SusC/RagA family TonB-linked outer membrane protein n=1 Tax=uncultured Aquimarina sp. TaxID=575652 RepID=UPI00261B96E5|nr:TonB-dependent receptor [uncultured Aquimarina sp.]